MKDLFLTPGRLAARVFSRDKKRIYRSTRNRSGVGLGTVILSLACWVALAAGVLFAVDKMGLLKQALDVGVEVAQSVEESQAPAPRPTPEPSPGSVTGSIADDSLSGASPPPVPEGGNAVAAPAVEAELWLVLLHTIPKSSRDEAERRQARYRDQGLAVEILDTDAFPRLKSGNWIIALGPFDDRISALAAADTAKAFNNGLIVRRGL